MTQYEFEAIKSELESIAEAIVKAKRPEYTQDSQDVLANFRRVAADTGITPLQAWLVYFGKHYASICRSVADPKAPSCEGIESRFADIRNYLDLGFALFRER